MDTGRISNGGIAAVLSFIFNGLGQLYNGQIFKGLTIVFLSSASMIVVLMGALLFGFSLIGRVLFSGQIIWGLSLFILGIISICVIGIYSIVDAYTYHKSRS
ncbi:MAG: hypothetical protein NC908_02635 [Candidatus Omnitrophica bacterium]|nr:hypothetical protein [Candidatus Omnitrophota bacterium]